MTHTMTAPSSPRYQSIARYLVAISLLVVTPLIGSAQAGGQPPLIDRQLFFGNPEISGAQLSPDGKYVAFVKPHKGTRNIWVKGINEPFTAAKLLTNDMRRPVTGYFWSRDGKYVLFVQDAGGDENFNVYAVDPAAPAPAGQEVPPARNLTSAEGVAAAIYAVPEDQPGVIFVGLNDRDKAWHDLYRVDIATGERTLMRENSQRITNWVFDNRGNLRLATRTSDGGDTEIMRVDSTEFTQVYSCGVFESCYPLRFDRNNERVYLATNRGDSLDLTRLVLFHPTTRVESLVESDPLNRVDFGSAVFSDLTNELVATTYEDERTRIYWRNAAWESDYRTLQEQLPGLDVSLAGATKDERLWMVAAFSDREPGARYLFNRDTKALTRQYRVFEELPREALAPMTAIRYRASDGLEVPAFLTLPVGVAHRNLPLVVVPHGGPWARDTWGYRALAQFLANRGYAVLQPNFRGSTGYGKKFLDAGNNEWGQLMQEDLSAGVRHLVAEGMVDPKRVGIMGGSYGGYATLAGLAFTPDIYAAGVSIVGPSNLITLLNSIPPYWEAIRVMFHKRMGDPNTPEGRAQLERQSPLTSASSIRVPLLVIQGANDPRVKQAESDQIVIALRDRGFPVEYIVAPDEGHGFARPVNNMAMFAAAENFLAKHLNGRYQESMPADVATRLGEITVDVSTVKLPVTVAVSTSAPTPNAAMRVGTEIYAAKIEVAGQTIPLELTRTTIDSGGAWIVREVSKMPMGTVEEQATIEKGTLLILERVLRQGPAVITVTYRDNKATGSMNMGGQERPISVELGGAAFADGAGSDAVIAALPLADGYEATFRNLDVTTLQVKLRRLKVVGTERVTVPAGEFDAHKVEISSADGGAETHTIWVDRVTHRVVKTVSVLPQMNGAVATAELKN